jgi:hypothetical protein
MYYKAGVWTGNSPYGSKNQVWPICNTGGGALWGSPNNRLYPLFNDQAVIPDGAGWVFPE